MPDILTAMIFTPLLGAVVILLAPKAFTKWIALVATLPPLVMAVDLYQSFDRTTAEMQFVTRVPWIPSFNIEYFVGDQRVSRASRQLNAHIIVPVGAGLPAIPQPPKRQFSGYRPYVPKSRCASSIV